MHGHRGRTDEEAERNWPARSPDHRSVRRAAHHGVAIPHAPRCLDGNTPYASRIDRKIVVKRIGFECPVQTAKPAEIRAAFRERIRAPRRDLARCAGQSGNERSDGGDPGDLRQRNAPSLSAGTGDIGTIAVNGSPRQPMRGRWVPRALDGWSLRDCAGRAIRTARADPRSDMRRGCCHRAQFAKTVGIPLSYRPCRPLGVAVGRDSNN